MVYMETDMATRNGKGWALGIAAGLCILALAALYDRAFNRLPELITRGDKDICAEVEARFIRLDAKIAGIERVSLNERRIDTLEQSRFVTSDQFTNFKEDFLARILEMKINISEMDKKLDRLLESRPRAENRN